MAENRQEDLRHAADEDLQPRDEEAADLHGGQTAIEYGIIAGEGGAGGGRAAVAPAAVAGALGAIGAVLPARMREAAARGVPAKDAANAKRK